MKPSIASVSLAVVTALCALNVSAESPATPLHPAKHKTSDATRNPGNVIFDETGVLVGSADAMPIDHYGERLKHAGVKWIALQIDNTGNRRDDNIAAVERGWADKYRKAGFKVGFWGCPRGISKHGDQAALEPSIKNVQADAKLGANLTAK